MKKTLDQALFDAIMQAVAEQGHAIYPSLPLEEVSYPFVNMISVQELPNVTKTHVKAVFSFSLTVWGTEVQRKKVAEMTAKIREACQLFLLGENELRAIMRPGSFGSLIRTERVSDSTILWRSDIDFELKVL